MGNTRLYYVLFRFLECKLSQENDKVTGDGGIMRRRNLLWKFERVNGRNKNRRRMETLAQWKDSLCIYI